MVLEHFITVFELASLRKEQEAMARETALDAAEDAR